MSDGLISSLPPGPRRIHLAAAACLLTLFVVYGSLVPLEFRALSWDNAVQQFKANVEFSFSVSRGTDWVAHFVLFLLMGFLWLGVIDIDRRSRMVGLVAAPFVLAILVAIGVGTEFIQQWTTHRTASTFDLSADVLGAFLGCVLWLLMGRWFTRFMRGLTEPDASVPNPSPTRGLLQLCVFGFLLYSLQPFDLTLRSEEISKQFQDHVRLIRGDTLNGRIIAQDRFTVQIRMANGQGTRTVNRSSIRHIQTRKVLWRPFSHSYKNAFDAAWQIGSDVLLFIPFGMLFRYRRGIKQTMLRTLLITMLAASLIEFAQIFVISRYLDTTDILCSLIGAWIGGTLASVFAIGEINKTDSHRDSGKPNVLVAVGLCVLYTVPLAVVAWHPYKLVDSIDVFWKQLSQILGVPFKSHYYAGESRALANLMRNLMLFLPVGALLRWGYGNVREGFIAKRLVVIVVASIIGFVLEAGKSAMPKRHADITDMMINVTGALVGWWLWGMVTRTNYGSAQGRPKEASSTFSI